MFFVVPLLALLAAFSWSKPPGIPWLVAAPGVLLLMIFSQDCLRWMIPRLRTGGRVFFPPARDDGH
jgi:hypothetical protein